MYYSSGPKHRPIEPKIKKKKAGLNVLLPFIAILLCMAALYYSAYFGDNADENEPADTDVLISDSPNIQGAENPDNSETADSSQAGNDAQEAGNSTADDTTADNSTAADISQTPDNPQDIVLSADFDNLKDYCESLFAGNIVALDGDSCLTDNGSIVNITPEDIRACFYNIEIPEDVFLRMEGKSYGADCTIPLTDLRYVRVLHFGFDGAIHIGELVVNLKIADDINDIFYELYEQKYPIEKMLLIDEFEANDEISMIANNTSCFNYRVVAGSSSLSNHAYGMAIDINPLYNPYVSTSADKTFVSPSTAAQYADRTLDCEYYIDETDACYIAFTSRGFTWGGNWNTKKDYQHFEMPLN